VYFVLCSAKSSAGTLSFLPNNFTEIVNEKCGTYLELHYLCPGFISLGISYFCGERSALAGAFMQRP
jgi:hypothetical protein